MLKRFDRLKLTACAAALGLPTSDPASAIAKPVCTLMLVLICGYTLTEMLPACTESSWVSLSFCGSARADAEIAMLRATAHKAVFMMLSLTLEVTTFAFN